MIFENSVKMYYFKDTKDVSFSIRVNDNFVNTYRFTEEQFDKIIENWNKPGGIEFRTNNGSWMFQHKKRGPRPVCEPANYVRVDFWRDEQSFHYRLSYDNMINIVKDYFYQKAHNV
jgi:hypothetical protein